MFNSKLEKNPEQSTAVQHILAGSSKPAPYLVFGPPGTGKTITIVEAMHQVFRMSNVGKKTTDKHMNMQRNSFSVTGEQVQHNGSHPRLRTFKQRQ